jgi:trigger factor
MSGKSRRGMGNPSVHLCDYRQIRLDDSDFASAKKEAADSPAEYADTMYANSLCTALVRRIVKDSKVTIPKSLAHDRAISMAMAMEDRLSADSHSLEDYYKAMGTNEDQLIAEMEEAATKQLESRAVLLAIAKAERLEATDSEYQAEVKRLGTHYPLSYDELDRFFRRNGEDVAIREDVAIEKASRFVTKLAMAQDSER